MNIKQTKLGFAFLMVSLIHESVAAFSTTAFRPAKNMRLFAGGSDVMPTFLTSGLIDTNTIGKAAGNLVDTDAISKAASNIDTAAMADKLGKISDSSLSKIMTEENKANAKDKFEILKGNWERQTSGLKDLVNSEDSIKKIATNLKDSAGDGGDAGAKLRIMQENFNKMKGDASGLSKVDPGEKLRLMKENLANMKSAPVVEKVTESPPPEPTEAPSLLDNSVSWSPIKGAASDIAETLHRSFVANAAVDEGMALDGSVDPFAVNSVDIGDAALQVADVGSLNVAHDMVADNVPLLFAAALAVAAAAAFSPRASEA